MGGEWGGLNSCFYVEPNSSVEVVLWLCGVVVGVVTIMSANVVPQYISFEIICLIMILYNLTI